MPGMPGTAEEQETVAPDVAETLDSMDPDELRTMVATLQSKIKEQESHIGRQNSVHGERLSRLERDLQDERQARATKEAEQEETARRYRLAAMDPVSRATEEAREAKAEINKIRQEQADAEARRQDQLRVQGVIEEAKRKGYDHTRVDTRSSEWALYSLDALNREYLEQKVKELESRQTKDREELVETAANLTGRRQVMTGSPTSAAKAQDRMDPEEKAFRDELVDARRRKDVDLIVDIKLRAVRAGIDLNA